MGAGLRDIAPKEVYSAKIDAAAGTGDVIVLDFSALHPNDSSKKIVVINFILALLPTRLPSGQVHQVERSLLAI
jgi:hypothetical protein